MNEKRSIFTIVKGNQPDDFEQEYEAIRILYKRSGCVTQAEFAKKCGVAASTITNVFSGQKGSLKIFAKIAKANGLTYQEFLDLHKPAVTTTETKQEKPMSEEIRELWKAVGRIEGMLAQLLEERTHPPMGQGRTGR